jgi:serine/threonine protein kinase
MDSRTALNNSDQLRFQNKEGGIVLYTINKEIGRGGSCIVYDAFYETNADDRKLVRIKECYPHKLCISRKKSGELQPSPKDMESFESAKEKLLSEFKLCNRLFNAKGLTDSMVTTFDIYMANNTAYIVSAYSSENTLAIYKPISVKSCVSLVKQVAYALGHIHNEGYLYLDTKPENVLIIEGQSDRIQLFDFDSLVPISAIHDKIGNIRLSYSKGFAAIELQMGETKKLGAHTDVYGVGALLFNLLFGVTPTAPNCEADANYDFTKMVYAETIYQDKLPFALTEFFRRTLANYYLDRYEDMQQAILKLEDIEKLADVTVPFVYSTRIITQDNFIGRINELKELNKWLKQKDNNCLFVTGMGGIGKSALIRELLVENRSKIDSILYLQYNDSLVRTLTDDLLAKINTTEKNDAESLDEYFHRKLGKFKEIVAFTNSILVIDDFTGENDRNIVSLLEAEWKVIFISRKNPLGHDYKEMPIRAIEDEGNLRLLFESNLGRSIDEQEHRYLNNIIAKIFGHTLVLQLLAKQIASSYLSVMEASELVNKHGFSSIASEKVVYEKDNVAYQETISNIIAALFDADRLSESKRTLLKTASLLDENGIDINLFHSLLKLESKDDINELIIDGWIVKRDLVISLHPVILEAIRHWDWNKAYKLSAIQLMESLFFEIRINGHKEDSSQKLLDYTQRMSQTPRLWKLIERTLARGGLAGKITRERYIRSSDKAIINKANLLQYVQLSEGILENCKREISLRNNDIYNNLLFCTILNMSRCREDFILERSEELLHDSTLKKGIAQMELFKRVVAIYEERKDFDAAYEVIVKAEQVAKSSRQNRNYVYALYYGLLSGYYDAKLNGAYDSVESGETACLAKLIVAIDKTIRYAKKSWLMQKIDKQFLAENLLAKAMILIRSCPEENVQIRELIFSATKIVFEFTQPYSKVRFIYYMVHAWYCTLVSPNYESAVAWMKQAREISSKTSTTYLDEIDNRIIPCANIFLELEQFERSAELIEEGIQLCEKYDAVIPYVRKKMELYGCILDVYYIAHDFERCRAIIEEIDRENVLHKELNIVKNISDELRDEVRNNA